jgi:hypothetical protein
MTFEKVLVLTIQLVDSRAKGAEELELEGLMGLTLSKSTISDSNSIFKSILDSKRSTIDSVFNGILDSKRSKIEQKEDLIYE